MGSFDKKQCELIASLLYLKGRCFFYEENILGELKEICPSNFYSSFRDVIDLLLFFLINEELSNSNDRKGFENLCCQVFGIIDERGMGEFCSNSKHFDDLRRVFVESYNSLLGSAMLDFTVSVFSNFENWIGRLFDLLCKDERCKMIESRRSKIVNYLKKLDENNYKDGYSEIANKINKIPKFDYFSFLDKCECLIRFIGVDRYKRNWGEDKKIIAFLSAKRNTVHNQGIHSGVDMAIEFRGQEFKLFGGNPYYSKKWTDDLLLFGELLDIYNEFLSSLLGKS